MNILFIGQLGIPLLNERDKSSPERRIEQLARYLANEGHQITVIGTKPYIKNSGNYDGIRLILRLSFNPKKPGGWLYLILSLVTLWQQQPDVVHLQGWRPATLLRLISALSPDSTRILTIDHLPNTSRSLTKYISGQADKWSHAITTPTRQTQYRLLQELGLRATYIPDGYHATNTPGIPLRHFKLRRKNYHIAFVSSSQSLRWLAQSYQKIRSKKRLIICHKPVGAYRRLDKQFSCLSFVGPRQGRTLQTLIDNAATVIAVDPTDSKYLLQAMAASRAIIASTDPLHQETLGVCALYFKPKDIAGLTQALKEAGQLAVASRLGQQAKLRAKRYFTIERTAAEYLSAYNYYTLSVPVDSIRSISFTKLPA